MTRKRLGCIFLTVILILATGCSPARDGGKRNGIDLNSLELDEIVSKAKEDGRINSVGMPDGWANWEGIWEGIEEKYGLSHTDVDLSSAEELAVFEAEKEEATKDIGDVGIN